jgi:sodium/proline symporter
MVRMMTIDSAEQVSRARNLYLMLTAILGFGATLVGLAARVLLPDLMSLDAELALPELALNLLPGVGVGFVLVGLFSATISTADAQVLSCAAALTQDLLPARKDSYILIKWGTIGMLGGVLGVALVSPDDVFALVTAAWACLAAGFGPVMTIRALQRPLNSSVAIAMMIAGVITALMWRLVFHLSADIYEVLPGMLMSTMLYLLVQPLVGQNAKLGESVPSESPESIQQ